MPRGTPSDRRIVTRRGALGAIAAIGGTSLAGCMGDTSLDDHVEFRSARAETSGLSGSITVRGSSTVYPVMDLFAQRFSQNHDEVVINTAPTGTGAGFADHFCTGNADFNNASRSIRDPEVEQCSDNGIEFVELEVATDAITVVLNNNADFVDCLTTDELASIWRDGGAQRWSDVRSSFPDESIAKFGAADTSGTYDYFNTHVLGESATHTTDYQATEQDNNIVSGVNGNKFAIGYLGFSYYYNNSGQVKPLAIDDGEGCTAPSLETASSGAYDLLSRPLFTYVAKPSLAQDHVAEFARYVVQQSTNQGLVADRVGYVPNSAERMGIELDELNAAIREVQQ